MESLSNQYSKESLKFLSGFKKELNILLNRSGSAMVAHTRKLQDESNNYASRNMSNSTNYKIKNKKNSIDLSFGSNAKSTKGYPYPIVMEFGRKPGSWPNISSLIKWVTKKVILGHIVLDEKLGKNKKQKIKNLAFIIARVIKKNGIKGRFFYSKGFEEGLKLFTRGVV